MIPRDLECWYCRKGQHGKCGLPRTCACRECYPREERIADLSFQLGIPYEEPQS